MGSTTTDGTVIWTTYESYTREGAITSVTDRGEFDDSSRTETSAVFDGGNLTWTSGDNNGRSMEVKLHTGAGHFKLFQKMGYDVQVGDTYKIVLGCRKTTAACNSFVPENGSRGNIYNYRGEPTVPSTDEVGKFGGQ